MKEKYLKLTPFQLNGTYFQIFAKNVFDAIVKPLCNFVQRGCLHDHKNFQIQKLRLEKMELLQ